MTLDQAAAPDLVIAGAARSGTSLLAAHLSTHPLIDGGAVKESNYFSKNFERGVEWYDAYYVPRSEKPLRLDASVSYTYPQYPEALPRLAAVSGAATVVYVVRDPVARAVSHYLLNRHYFEHESAPDLGASMRERSFYTDVSDYGAWISRLLDHFPDQQVVVVPFDAVKASAADVAAFVCDRLGVDAPPIDAEVSAHQNNVVTFRSETMRKVTRRVRHSSAYPVLRRTLSPLVLRKIRAGLTRVPDLPSVEDMLETCSPAQLAELEDLRLRAGQAVVARLRVQDERWGSSWAEMWTSGADPTPLGADEEPPPASGGGSDVEADQAQGH